MDLKNLVKMLEKDYKRGTRVVNILISEIAVRLRKLIVEAVLKEVAA